MQWPSYDLPTPQPEHHIIPHLHFDASDPFAPTFTTDEAILAAMILYANREYLTDDIRRTGSIDLVQATFVPTMAEDTLLGFLDAPVPQTPVLCQVLLHGNNLYTRILPDGGHTIHGHAYVIFDGRTGDLIVMNVHHGEADSRQSTLPPPLP
jgi:hypothetical protein